MAVVAERAGVSRGAAQHHFPTREALFTAALEHMTQERGEQMRRELTERPGGPADTATIVDVVFALFTGPLFRAALTLWVAAAAEPPLREQIVPLEARIGREMHRRASSTCSASTSACRASARPCRPPSTSPAGWAWRTCSPTTADAAQASPGNGPPFSTRLCRAAAQPVE